MTNLCAIFFYLASAIIIILDQITIICLAKNMTREEVQKGEPLIEINNLTWGYPNSPSLIFDKFSFELKKGDFMFVTGESGSGKTTLIKFLIRQLVPPRKTVFFQKEDISRYTDAEVQKYRRKIGVVFQDYKLVPWKSVWDNVILPMQLVGFDESKAKGKAEEILRKVGLLGMKDVMVPFLSWGEKQRVAIARALMLSPQLLIADEPTGNLDEKAAASIVDLFVELHREGNTVLFITHDKNLIRYASSLVEIKLVEIKKQRNLISHRI